MENVTFTELSCELPVSRMAANGLNIVAVRIEDKCSVVVRMIVGPKPWLAVVAPARTDSRCVKAVDGSAIRNRKSHGDTSNGRRFQTDPEEGLLMGSISEKFCAF